MSTRIFCPAGAVAAHVATGRWREVYQAGTNSHPIVRPPGSILESVAPESEENMLKPDIAPAVEPVPTPEETRKAAAQKRAETWRRLMTRDRGAVIDRLRSMKWHYEAVHAAGSRSDDVNLAADLLDDIADGRL